jgi:hypothetical protein
MARVSLEGDFAIAGKGEILISDYWLAGQDIGIDHVELPLGRLEGIADYSSPTIHHCCPFVGVGRC